MSPEFALDIGKSTRTHHFRVLRPFDGGALRFLRTAKTIDKVQFDGALGRKRRPLDRCSRSFWRDAAIRSYGA